MYTRDSDQCKNRKDKVALPICYLTLTAKKSTNIPQNPQTLGEHIRKRRLEKHLLQSDVANIIRVSETTIFNWENSYSAPQILFIPRILKFLGYNPLPSKFSPLVEKIISYRYENGLTQRALAQKLNINVSTLRRWEQGCINEKKLKAKISFLLKN
ncbi:MAG: helix-turn-helix domain-containing protein [Melioribacteraceae bacterium]|nr:helix-turn-helix domain-containing protein [Melioribacteraceae bacterium]